MSSAPQNGRRELIGPQLQGLLNQIDQQRAEEAQRGIRAWLLAPTIDVYEALMRGEAVPTEQLNADAVHRYGLKR